MLLVFRNSNAPLLAVTRRAAGSLPFDCGKFDRKVVAKLEDSVLIRCLGVVWLFGRMRIFASVGQCSATDDLEALLNIR